MGRKTSNLCMSSPFYRGGFGPKGTVDAVNSTIKRKVVGWGERNTDGDDGISNLSWLAIFYDSAVRSAGSPRRWTHAYTYIKGYYRWMYLGRNGWKGV